MDPITSICNVIMTGYADVAHTNPQIAEAERRLGKDRYLDVVIATMRAETKKMILDPATREQVEVAGGLGAKVAIAGVVTSVVKAVLEAR